MNEPQATSRPSEKEIFMAALEQATPQERAAFLDSACASNSSLRRGMEDLLSKHFQQDGFMEEPAAEVAPTTDRPPPLAEGPGTTIDRYKLLEKLGEGGFGAVYVAEQKEPVRRRVALKIIKLGMDSQQVVARFEAERQALALMDHPNIAKVLDAGATAAGRPYFVMELVRGVPITQYCDENNLRTRQRLDLFIAVCHAVQHAHQKGIIHRDIKPTNILVTLHDGQPVPKVIDFGIAKATHGDLTDKTIYTQFQQLIGTPAYLSPEQAEMSGLDIDTRSDIYSLGVLLYELLVGRTPFDAKELVRSGLDEMRRIIREQEPSRPSTRLSAFPREELTTAANRRGTQAPKLIHALRGDIDCIVMKCLEKDRRRRYDTASSLADDLKRFLASEPIMARPPSRTYRLKKLILRNQGVAAAAAAIALTLILGLGLSTFAFLRERQARIAQAAAEKETQAETVRADAVREFMDQLLGTTAPELLLQGHQRPVRDLLRSADRLASTALPHAPAEELHLRGLISLLYLGEGPSLMDSAAASEQMKRMNELLPSVPDDKLPTSRENYRIGTAVLSLWTGHAERGLSDLKALKEEFARRTPPDNGSIAWSLAQEGVWHVWKGEAELAVEKLTEALRVAPADAPLPYFYFIRIHLAVALGDRGELAEAENVAREGLLPPAKVTPDLAAGHVALLAVVVDALCQQQRFSDAESLVVQQKRELTGHGFPPRELLKLEKQRGEIRARAGDAKAALPILMSVAANPLSAPQDCADAAFVAIGAGDQDSYRRMCALGLGRFAAGAEGISALTLAEMLLAAPQDELVLLVASDLVDRVEVARDFSKDLGVGLRQWLVFRQGDLTEAAALAPKASTPTFPAAPIAARFNKSGYMAALVAFHSALPYCHLDRPEEARKAFAEGIDRLGQSSSPENPRDLGASYALWYLADAHRREAEQALLAKGIAIPEGE